MLRSEPLAAASDSGQLFQSLVALSPAGVYLTDVRRKLHIRERPLV